ncbi:hypothetical protein SNEBB_000339 [Seison nebaliae]|nr:hypothetical protein SNEBB_000339 [Seison nebaliae]
MILLDIHNLIVEQQLKEQFAVWQEKNRLPTFNITLYDFDGVKWNLKNHGTNKNIIIISIHLPLDIIKWIKEYNGIEFLKKEYGDRICYGENDYHLEVTCDFSAEQQQDIDKLSLNVAMLRRHCFAAIFEHFFNHAKIEKPPKRIEEVMINYRSDESIFFRSSFERITVIFSIVFHEQEDMLLSRSFIHGLYEARQRQRQAPQVIFNDKQIPKEVENYYNKENLDDGRVFVTFVLEKRHFQERTKDNTVNLLHVLRNYLHYHIKSFKTCIHQHMQRKTDEFLKVLNRAKPSSYKQIKSV